MTELDQISIEVDGELTMHTYPEQVMRAKKIIGTGPFLVDLKKVMNVDSSAIAFMLDCVRSRSGRVVFRSLPDSLIGLIRLYGVDDLFDTGQIN